MEVGLRANSSAAVVSPTAPAAPTLGKDLRWPTNFKKEYLLGKCIGSGAFGTVHLAIHRATGQQVAVKIMSKTRAKQTRDKTVAKLQREVDQLNSLARCEHVVKLQGKFEDDGFAYLVMEHCGGGDLDQLIQVWNTSTALPDIQVADNNRWQACTCPMASCCTIIHSLNAMWGC